MAAVFRKVLILSATAGAGHVRAGQAMEKAFRQLEAAEKVRHIDVLRWTNPVFRSIYSDAYIRAVNAAPGLLGWFYERTNKPGRVLFITRAVNQLNTGPFVRLIRELGPDLVVCTHFLPSEILGRLRRKGRLSCPVALIVTDLDCHAMWLSEGVDQYFVALEETAEHLRRVGVPAERVHVVGIPIDPVFAEPVDKIEARRMLGLEEDWTTILVAMGGFGVGPAEFILANLLERLQHRAQIVAVCGKNRRLQEKLEALVPKQDAQRVRLRVIGYTQEMDRYMAAADVMVGKAGGLSISEALARQLPMCIVNPVLGQEERNADHLLEAGAAIRCNNLPALAWKLDRLLDDPERLEAMRRAAQRLARPRAALDIVQRLVELYGTGSLRALAEQRS